MSSLKDLANFLQTPILRVRTGLLLVPTDQDEEIVDEAIRHNIDYIDVRKYWLDNLPMGTELVMISSKKIIRMLDDISENQRLKQCVIIYNFDILISYLKYEDRKFLWNHIINNMPHRSRGLLLTMPLSKVSDELLPSRTQLATLKKETRLVT